MGKQKFNARKFLKSIKNNLGKRSPDPVEDEQREDDLDSLNEEPKQDEGRASLAEEKEYLIK